jgi:CMD domain protein
MTADVIDRLVGVSEGDSLDAVRRQRPDAKANAQASYDALFDSDDLTQVSQLERRAVAYWAVALTQSPTAGFYRELLAAEPAGASAVDGAALATALDVALEDAVTVGPYGDFPAGPLSVENVAGLHWTPSAPLAAAAGGRLAAALAHTHLLTYRPRDASGDALQALLDAGWSTTGIVTLSQLVSFLAFQSRVVAGLTVLKGAL